MSNSILDAHAAGIAQVADLLTYAPADLSKVPTDGGWSAAQVLGHLADAEISVALRIRMMFTTNDYTFLSWDEDLFANLNPNRNIIKIKKRVKTLQNLIVVQVYQTNSLVILMMIYIN